MTDPLLTPGPDTRPYTPRAGSLVDVDHYVAQAPGPVVSLYEATVGDLLTPMGSPSLGLVAPGGRAGPPPLLGIEPYDEMARTISKLAWAEHPREWDEGSESSAAGRYDRHLEGYAPWIDLVAMTSPGPLSGGSLRPGPLIGRSSSGAPAAAPGFLLFVTRTGLWRDLDRDRFVGAPGADPYQGGTRPMADDYEQSRGEFVGLDAIEGADFKQQRVNVTLVPDGGWPSPGIVPFDWAGLPRLLAPHEDESQLIGDVQSPFVEGTKPLVLEALAAPNVAGLYQTPTVWFPTGTLGFSFRVCFDDVRLRFELQGVTESEIVWDCDVVESWNGLLA